MLHRYFFILILALLTGCASAPPHRLEMSAGYCDPPVAYRYNPAFAPVADFDAALTPALLARYTRRNLLTANAAGILPILKKLVDLPANDIDANNINNTNTADLARQISILKQRQIILMQLNLVSSTISSVAAELDCEGERADQMAGYLASLDNDRTQRLNVMSIGIGALSGIGTTVSTNRHTQYAFGVGGGLVAAGLGLMTLSLDGHTNDFQHPRNLLADVWAESPGAADWPPSIWYMLTNPAFSNQGQTSIAHNTRLRWQHYGPLTQPESADGRRLVSLLFGTGGTYSADQLTVRANMLNELQSSVRLLSQEMQGLLLVLSEDP